MLHEFRLPGEGRSEPVPVCIAVVDPLPMFRHGMTAALEAAGHAVESPVDIMAWARHQTVTLVLLTVQSEHDWELLGRLGAGESHIVIALLDNESALFGARAVGAGARSVLSREVTVETLLRTVQATIAGQAVMPAAVVAALTSDARGGAEHGPSADQLSWLRQLANGATVAQLADRAGYSERAMFRLLRALYRQLGVHSRIQAIMRAHEAGWL